MSEPSERSKKGYSHHYLRMNSWEEVNDMYNRRHETKHQLNTTKQCGSRALDKMRKLLIEDPLIQQHLLDQ